MQSLLALKRTSTDGLREEIDLQIVENGKWVFVEKAMEMAIFSSVEGERIHF